MRTIPEMHTAIIEFSGLCHRTLIQPSDLWSKYILEVEFGSKFARLVKSGENRQNRSSWCFVAIVDGATKQLGEWKQGDIFRCATWHQPAKHSRGNIFDSEKGLGKMTVYGPEYLR